MWLATSNNGDIVCNLQLHRRNWFLINLEFTEYGIFRGEYLASFLVERNPPPTIVPQPGFQPLIHTQHAHNFE